MVLGFVQPRRRWRETIASASAAHSPPDDLCDSTDMSSGIATTTTRRMRAFKRWMRSHNIEHSPSIDFVDSGEEGIWVRALCSLQEGDLVATIPKEACLTTKNSGARSLIEEAGLGGSLGLAVAVMFERSLGQESPWAGYLQLLPEKEPVPLAWSVEEVNELLAGTELHKVTKEDKILVYEDWKENILPLVESKHLKLDEKFFGFEQYISAKSLVGSRSFTIDDYHGSGMVPVADLFNHKTGAEDVHFTSVCSTSSSDDEDNDNNDDTGGVHEDIITDDKSSISELDSKSTGDDPTKLEMILVKDVEAGAEVFNTYGAMGNAALLHRYGFTEPDNPFDIVNIDLYLVEKWGTSLFSSRFYRRRLSLWRQLNYSGCGSENSEYFEITIDGLPQVELLVLLYITSLNEDSYEKLNLAAASFKDSDDNDAKLILLNNKLGKSKIEENQRNKEDFLLTEDVCRALVALADARESSYGSDPPEADFKRLCDCCCVSQKKLYNSLVLRLSERTILERLRCYALQFCKTRKRKL